MNPLHVLEDSGTAEEKSLRNRVHKALQQQIKTVEAQMMVSHERSCGIFDCPALNGTASFCFKPESDKVLE